jgi:hypothetical protein
MTDIYDVAMEAVRQESAAIVLGRRRRVLLFDVGNLEIRRRELCTA